MPPIPRKTAGGSRRYDTIVFLLLLCLLIFAGGGVARYVYIDRPAARAQKESRLLMQKLMEENQKNQQQLELRLAEAKAQTEALRANMEQLKAENLQAKAAVAEPVPEPAAKPPAKDDTQAAERKRLERARAADELAESLAPKLQVRFDPKVVWMDHSVTFAFSLTNAGRRAIRVAQPRITLNLHPLPNMRPSALKPGDVHIEVCPAGLIEPGETLNCSGILRAEASFTGVGHISFQALISARTDLPAGSETWKAVRAAHKDAGLESRMAKDVPVSGDLWR
ncbi:hypothetical protein [Polaromonas sp. YR568]|uniref:hypothetical protein n=1 Tax=Polaromonas sp. YR568 TaxID=1855301 RepID=UPI00398C0132